MGRHHRQLAERGPAATALAATPALAPLTLDELKPIVNEAIAEWAKAGLSSTSLDALRNAKFSIADLPGAYLGWTTNGQVFIDRDAAGYGWFVDPTPGQDEEFQPTKNQRTIAGRRFAPSITWTC